MSSRKKIIHGARIEISGKFRNNHVSLCNILWNLEFKVLLPHSNHLQNWKTQDVLKYFSAHSGIHGFAPMWHIFSKICAIWVQNHVCQNVQKNISLRPLFSNFANACYEVTDLQIPNLTVYYTGKCDYFESRSKFRCARHELFFSEIASLMQNFLPGQIFLKLSQYAQSFFGS